MYKKRHLSLKDCYQILQVSKKATYEEVKRAYRKRAFALHPDLNPGKPEASSNFQTLNEAYVKLSHFLKSQQSANTHDTNYKDNYAEPSKEARQNANEAYTKEKNRAGHEQNNSQAQEKPKYSQNDNAQDDKSQNSKSQSAEHKNNKEQNNSFEQKHTNETGYEGSKEDVLRDLLNDPFAKRVFQDIYSEINKKNSDSSSYVDVNVEQVATQPKPKKPKKIKMEWGSKEINLDFTYGVGGIVKNWLRSQIDESQNFKFPATKLRPGARLRFQIRRGLSGELATVEITLPSNFIIGKPVRLKGLGKKVGPWKGDLYLLLEPLEQY